jgi:SAM-dependent methyltransferase
VSQPTAPSTRANLDKRPDEVAAMFDGVAERYDRTNTILSFGRDRGWRNATRDALKLTSGERVLDLAAGTGVSTEELARSGAEVIGVDISQGMLRAGKKTRPGTTLLAGDALALPFADATFDAVTISFGPRDQARRPAGRVRVLAPDERRLPARLPLLSHGYASRRRPAGLVKSGRIRLSCRVHPSLAGSGRSGREGGREWLGAGRVAQSDRWHRRSAPRGPERFLRLGPPRRMDLLRPVLHSSPDEIVKTFTSGLCGGGEHGDQGS